MSTMPFTQFAVVLSYILIGAQADSIGLGILGGIGLAVLPFSLHLQPTSPPIDVMLMIMAVVPAAAATQANGGLDHMIKIATCVLHHNPKYITFIAPAVTYAFIMLAGTDHVAYSILSMIAEVGRRNGIRPSRPLTVVVIVSQFAIVTSSTVAAVVACVPMLGPQHITTADVLKVTVPSAILSIGLACMFIDKLGKELKDNPHYQALLRDLNYVKEYIDVEKQKTGVTTSPKVKLSIDIFLAAALLVIVMGALPELHPAFEHDDAIKSMGMVHMTEIAMLSASTLIILACKSNNDMIIQGSVLYAGVRAVIAVLGVARLGDALMNGHLTEMESTVSHLTESTPRTFVFALSVLPVLVNSQGATVATPSPITIKLGIPAPIITGVFVAVSGYLFIPNYSSIIASIDFDVIGSTRIGKYIFNHGFMIPGLLSMTFSLTFGLLLVQLHC